MTGCIGAFANRSVATEGPTITRRDRAGGRANALSKGRSARLDGAPRDQHFVALVVVVEFVMAQVLDRQPLQERGRREHVAMRLDADVLGLERLGQQTAQRLRREAPVL